MNNNQDKIEEIIEKNNEQCVRECEEYLDNYYYKNLSPKEFHDMNETVEDIKKKYRDETAQEIKELERKLK